MVIPGFSAEASLYKSTRSYLTTLQTVGGKGESVFLSFLPPGMIQPSQSMPQQTPHGPLDFPAGPGGPVWCIFLGMMCDLDKDWACEAKSRQCQFVTGPQIVPEPRPEHEDLVLRLPSCDDPDETLCGWQCCKPNEECRGGFCLPRCPEDNRWCPHPDGGYSCINLPTVCP
jgi:hypothetical protein